MTLVAPAGGATGHAHRRARGWHDARKAAWSLGADIRPEAESVDVHASAGRTLAHDVRALDPLPGFDSAAMDGWALGAGPGPWILGAPVDMGGAPDSSMLAPGTARPITTGGPLPAGARSVLRSEDGRVEGDRLHAAGPDTAIAHGRHVRRAGEESAAGEVLVRCGDTLTPPRCALVAAAGHDVVPVRRRPRVALLTLGDEVLQRGRPAPGAVRDVFGPSVRPIVEAFGATASDAVAALDDLDATERALREALGDGTAGQGADVVLTTGGTAQGTGDHLRAALERVGARIVIDGVAVRPGHPVTVAVLPDGRIVLGLPGNPLAGLLCLVAFGGAILAGALGRPLPALGSATAAETLPNPTASTRLVACVATDGAVLPLGRQGSAMLRGLAAAEAVAVVPPGGTHAGEIVETLPLPW